MDERGLPIQSKRNRPYNGRLQQGPSVSSCAPRCHDTGAWTPIPYGLLTYLVEHSTSMLADVVPIIIIPSEYVPEVRMGV